uniref:UDP-glucuronosyltransferase n=1 Tax=Parascaris univalens TaxID=6257 RepID=A0A914ZVY3_PARUN
MRLLRYILFAFFSSRLNAKQMKFLFYSPSWGHSHLRFQGALIDILVDAGHIAHVLVPEFNPNIKTNGTAKAHRVIRISPSAPSLYLQFSFNKDPFTTDENDSDSAQLAIFMNVTMQFCKDFLQRKDLIEELQAEHYDVGFTEFFDYCPIGLLHHVGVRSVAILSAVSITDLLANTWGIPSPSSYVTNNFVPFINAPNLSISQRFMNFAFTFLSRKVSFARLLNAQNSMFRSMVREDFPDLRLLAQNAPAAFINSPQIVDIPRPISSKIVYVGGIAMKKRSNLSEEFSSILDRADSRVILFSLGSITKISKMPHQMRIAFLEATKHFPDYDFIVKVDSDSNYSNGLLNNYPNVHVFKWIDQVSILQHRSTKAFVTHAGLNSLIEAFFSATPVVCIPLFADQKYNTVMALRKNVAVYIDRNAISTDVVVDALNKVLNDPTYAKNSRKLRERLLKYPLDAKALFLKWSEYLAEFGNFPDLNLYGAEIGSFQYFLLDIFLIIFVVIVCLFFVIAKIGCIISRKFSLSHKKKTE